MRNSFKGREAFVTLDDRSARVDVRVVPELLADVESIMQKDQVWVVEGGIAYDDFNNGIKLRAVKVQLLDDYRCAHARALHINLNGDAERVVDSLIRDLGQFRSNDAMPVIFHLQYEEYKYQLRSNGEWSIRPDEQCLLTLQRSVDKSQFYFDYP